jgi:hypothetical protein
MNQLPGPLLHLLPPAVRRVWPPGNALRFLLVLHGLYWVWVPLTDRLLGIDTFFGFRLDLSPARDATVFRIYITGFLALFLGYATARAFQVQASPEMAHPPLRPGRVRAVLWILFVLIQAAVLFNIQQSGVSLLQLFNPFNQAERDIMFSVSWRYPFIDQLSNALPVLLFLLVIFRPPGRWPPVLVLALLMWFGLSLLGGWRYRLILLFLFFVFRHLAQGRVPGWRPLLTFGFAVAVFFSWLTLNRMAIAKRQFHLVTFDLRQFDPGVFNMEFSNSRTFRASLQYMEATGAHHPGPVAWTGFLAARLQPRNRFPGGIRPEPWILKITRAWIPPGWPWNPKPAVTFLEESFLTFGYAGLVFFGLALGAWAAFLDRRRVSVAGIAFQAVATALLFQWVSRGFFLFQIQIALICLLPFAVLYGLLPYLRYDSGKDPA